MIKAISMGIGAFLIILGLALHAVDSYTVRPRSQVATAFGMMPTEPKVVAPEPWKPWAYSAAGIVLCLWTCTLPAKMKGK